MTIRIEITEGTNSTILTIENGKIVSTNVPNDIVSTEVEKVDPFDWTKYPSIETVMSNTRFDTEERAKAAIQTLAWLEDGAPHKFDGLAGRFRFNMETFVDTNDYGVNEKEETCGTACCIGGAIYSYCEFQTLEQNEFYSNYGNDLDNYFNISMGDGSELDKLFYPTDRYGNIIKKKPYTAARTLRRYMETGKVNWRKTVR